MSERGHLDPTVEGSANNRGYFTQLFATQSHQRP